MRRLRVMVLTLVVVLVAANAPAWGHGEVRASQAGARVWCSTS